MARTRNKLKVKFTERKNFKPGLYGDGEGLYLQVSNRRTKAWVFRYMILGSCSEDGARRLRPRDSRRGPRGRLTTPIWLVQDGRDPIEERNGP